MIAQIMCKSKYFYTRRWAILRKGGGKGRKSNHKNTTDMKFLALEMCQITPNWIHYTCLNTKYAHRHGYAYFHSLLSILSSAVPLQIYLADLHCLFHYHVSDRSWILSLQSVYPKYIIPRTKYKYFQEVHINDKVIGQAELPSGSELRGTPFLLMRR